MSTGRLWRRRAATLCALLTLSCANEEATRLLGDTCERDGECSSGRCDELVCKSSAPVGQGAPCAHALECLSENCLPEGICGPGQRPLDDACTEDAQCTSGACVEQICSASLPNDGGVDLADSSLPNADAAADGALPEDDATADGAPPRADGAADTLPSPSDGPSPDTTIDSGVAFDGSTANDMGALGSKQALPICSADGWCQLAPSPRMGNIYSLWGTGTDDLYAVGAGGMFMRHDGTQWWSITTGSEASLRAVWGTANDDIYIAGDGGKLLHYDGATLRTISAGSNSLRALWGSGPTDVHAVGENGAAHHYDGTSWRGIGSGQSESLHDIWGASASAVFAAGDRGTIVRYDGSSWAPSWSGTTANLSTIWGSSPSDVFAGQASDPANIIHFDGTVWAHQQALNTSINFSVGTNKIWGTGPTNVYALASSYGSFDIYGSTQLWRFDGASWSEERSWGYAGESAIWGRGAGEIYFGGRSTFLFPGGQGVLWRYDGTSLEKQVPLQEVGSATAVWGSGPSDIFLVGREGAVTHFDGSSWQPMDVGHEEHLRAVWGNGPTNVYVVGWHTGGTREACRYYDGSRWRTIRNIPALDYHSVWVASSGELFMGATGGKLVRRSGSTWSEYTRGAEEYYGLWGADASTVIAVGSNGAFERFDGAGWTRIISYTFTHFRDVWGASAADVYVVGDAGAIYHYDGSDLTSMTSPTSEDLTRIWGSGPSDIYAVGDAGTILHFDGSAWTSMDSTTTLNLAGVWGSSAGDVLAVGGANVFRRQK